MRNLAAICAVVLAFVWTQPATAQTTTVFGTLGSPVTYYYSPSAAYSTVLAAPTVAYYGSTPTVAYYGTSVAAPVTSYYAPTTAYYAPTTSYYAPTTAYYAPTTAYYAPTTSYYAPTTAYYAPAYTAQYAPAYTTNYFAAPAASSCCGY